MAATMWNETIENFVRGEQNEGCHHISKEITSGKETVEHFIESMGPYLTSTEVGVRTRGVQLMSDVMTGLPRDFLDERQVRVLLEFFCARLLDHHSITQHTLRGLLAMSFQINLPQDAAVSVLSMVFKEVQVQTLLHVDRRSVFNLFANFLRTSLKEVQGMGSEFVLGFLHAMDGEKDPRNLIILFNILPTVISNFKIDMFIEELFEVVACYFPVDFHPPPNDPYGIGRDDLATSLKKCLSATPKFAQFCLPMVMEKLSSSLQAARLDSYQLLQACAPVYSQRELMGYLEAVWSYCRKELMQGISAELDQEALRTLVAVVTAVSSGVQVSSRGGGGDGDLESFLRGILTECRQHLCEPDHRMIHPCSKLLVAIATASYPACTAVLRYAIPILLDQFHIFDQTRERMVLLDVIRGLLAAGLRHLSEPADWQSVLSHHHATVVSTILATLTKQQKVPELRQAGLATLAEVVQIPDLLDQANLDHVGTELTGLLVEETNKDVRHECIKTISCLAKLHAEFVRSSVLTALWTKVQEGGEGSEEILGDIADVATSTSDEMSSSLTVDLMREIAKTEHGADRHIIYLATLNTVTNKLANNASNLSSLLQTVVYPILRIVVSTAVHQNADMQESPLCCGDVLVAVAKVIRAVVPKLDSQMAKDLCQCAIDVFLHGNLSALQLSSEHKFLPFKSPAPAHQSQLVTVLQPIMCSLRRDVLIPSSQELMKSLSLAAQGSPSWLTSTWAAKCLAGIVNKHPTGEDLDLVLSECETSLQQCLAADQQELVQHRALFAWSMLTKALVMRSHQKATAFLSTLLQLLVADGIGGRVSESLGLVLADSEDVLSEAMHADIKLMYKQRVFLQAMPTVMALFEKEATQARGVAALCQLLPSVPRAVLLGALPPVLPRLVLSLRQAEDPRPTLPILDILASLIAEGFPTLLDRVDELLPVLLQLSSYQPAMKVRIASLRCLSAMTVFPHHLLFPHQQRVVRALVARLDDKKRLVRQEAVTARTKWILLQQDTKR